MSSLKSKMSEYRTPSKIIGVQFSILSPEEIRKTSVVEVTSRDTYINNKPVIGGLFDPRMGVLEPGILCPTDGLTYIDTPGYFGHIELARPVFFIQHLKEIMKILKCICFKCSKILINKNHHKHVSNMQSDKRWDYVCKLAAKVKRCGDSIEDGCGCKQPDSIKLEGMAMIYAIWTNIEYAETDGPVPDSSKKIKMRLTPEIILKIFKRISDEDIGFMGFSTIWSRPEWMICQVLPIAPPAVRPSVKHDAQQRSEDDLTHIYCNIIKTNNDLFAKIKDHAQANAIEGLSTLLQYFIAMIVNNKVKGSEPMAQRSGRPMQCIMGRLNSKNGRIRGNLMGKRVDFSARSVITGDPNLSIRQLGVPLKIAMNITKPVVVNDLTRDFLLKLIQNGPDVYPGAKILEKKNGENISLRYVDRKSIRLENGDIVHRHIMNDDAILFNRQPSLHRMSMMCHRAKIMKKGDTFRMNVGCTKPYNADFDGDEMNAHFPQNVLSETELKHLAAIPYQIISPASNAPIIGIYQDSMLGTFRFTRANVVMDHRKAMNLLMMYKNVNVQKLLEKEELTSFDILSQIMPPITMMYTKTIYDDEAPNVIEIRNGTYVRGQIEKSTLGSSTRGIIHRACNDFNNMTACNFIDDLQNVITEYMKTSSFSVGVSDLIADRQTNEKIIQTITNKKLEVQAVIDELHLGTFKNTTASSNKVEFETKVNNLLNKANEESGKIGRNSLSKNNRFLMIVNSGSKGSLINISQMISCIGQQNVDGKRIPYGFDSRTLPHYNKFDDSPNARGFIENSYITGLTAPELFFHAMGGRIGLIDTAVKTSQTGYIQRRLIKGLEDLKIEYDMTVRNSKGKIVQFMYGDDGFDSTRVENQSIQLPEMSLEDIYMHYEIIGLNENDSNLLNIYSKGTITRMKKQRSDTKQKCKKYIEEMIANQAIIIHDIFKNKNEKSIKMPVAFQNIIVNIQGQLNLTANSIVDITPLEAFELIEEYFIKLNQIHFVPPTPLFKIMYFFYLTPRDLLVNKRFHRKAIVLLLENIILKYKQAIVHPGEMVGVIAGQSIGEPTTQLTLNTFHLAGVASKSNVTRGVPRIEEILRLTKNPKNPSLTVHLKPVDEMEQEKAIQFSNMTDHTKLVDLVKSVEICFDPNEENTFIKDDALLIAQFNEFEKIIQECMESPIETTTQSKSKWVVRMEIDPELLLDKNITMDDIHFAIKNSHYGNDINCVYSDYNMDKLIFRIRMNSSVFAKTKKKGSVESLDQSDEIYMLKNFQDSLLNNIVLRGINGVNNVIPRKVQNMLIKEDSKYIKKDIWVLDTTGSNLLETLALEYIDATRTYSNDIKEVFDVLGIEAARQVLFNELSEVMEFADVYINYHHLSLLCDRMTCTKDMVAIFRSGILNDDIGPISKSTFEVQTEVLLDAARHAELEHMRGVSSNVMMGQYGYFGTNAFNLVWDMKEMTAMESANAIIVNKEDEIEKQFGISNEPDKCSKANIMIKNNIEHIKINTNMGACDDDYNMGF